MHENWWTQHGNMRLGTWGGGGSTASESERYGRSGIHYKVKNVEMQDVENCCVKDKCVFRDVKIIFRYTTVTINANVPLRLDLVFFAFHFTWFCKVKCSKFPKRA